jgi:electron transfer flavoprotein alpha subunit
VGKSNLGDISVLIEHTDNQIDALSLQLLNKARVLADRSGVKVTALVLGSGINSVAELATSAGADRVLVADYGELSPYNPEVYTEVVAEMVREEDPSLLLLGYSFLGMEIAPAVSARLGIPLISNCADLDLSEDGSPVVVRPVHNGFSHVKMQGSLPLIISVQKGALSGRPGTLKSADVITFDTRFETISLRTVVKEVIKPAPGEVDLTKASVIVATGRGIGQQSNLSLFKTLADALGGVIAATRPVIDMGWLPAEYLAGMSESQLIVAINKDINVPIFRVAHYAIVGDIFEVVPSIIKAASVLKIN